ncbi:MAG: SET domain-containing protein [archaeon]|jgi:SET domain-containing protein
MNSKEKVVKKILGTYCRLKTSKIHGIGIFAIRDIPKGADPFENEKRQKWIKINKKEFAGADKEIIKLLEDFFWFDENGEGWVPEGGINEMGISFYSNHSKKPNIRRIDEDGNFITLRLIKKGEELLVDYETYDEED